MESAPAIGQASVGALSGPPLNLGLSSLMEHHPGLDCTHKCISGLGMSPASMTPSGMPTIPGKSFDSNHTGDPQSRQKQRTPRPESNLPIAASLGALRSAESAIAQAAGEVPANLRQFEQ